MTNSTDKPARIDLDALEYRGGERRRGVSWTPRKRGSGDLMVGIAIGLAAGLLLSLQEVCSSADDKSNPELPVASPVALERPGELPGAGNDGKHFVTAPVNDQHVPPATFEVSEEPHSGKRTPK